MSAEIELHWLTGEWWSDCIDWQVTALTNIDWQVSAEIELHWLTDECWNRTALIDRWVMKWLHDWQVSDEVELHWLTGESWNDCIDWQVSDEVTALASGSSCLDELSSNAADNTTEDPHGFSAAHASHSCGTGQLSHSVNHRCWRYVDIAVRHTPIQASHPHSGISVELANSVTWSVNRAGVMLISQRGTRRHCDGTWWNHRRWSSLWILRHTDCFLVVLRDVRMTWMTFDLQHLRLRLWPYISHIMYSC